MLNDLKEPVVIIGAGMSGLLAAFLVKKRRPDSDIVIVEASNHAGGEYRGVELEGFGYCDRAMRVIYDTGIPEFDEILASLLPQDEWHVLPGNRKDVVGLYWRDQLQTGCQYIDLRRLPESTRQQCEQEILRHAQNGHEKISDPDAATHLTQRFGAATANHLIRALEKLYRRTARELHASATCHPAMNRVILYDKEKMQPVLRDESLRAVIAWPDQLSFPLERRPPQAGRYPRRFGMNHVIDSAVKKLEQLGVRFLFQHRVVRLQTNRQMAEGVSLDDGTTIQKPSLIICANGLLPSLNLLSNGHAVPPSVRAPERSWMVFLRTVEPPAMGPLYHFFCYDEKYAAFRVTNYARYCPDAQTKSGFPICVELWSEDEHPQQAIARATTELRQMHVLNGGEITAQAALPSPNFHALCTMERVEQMRAVRREVCERSPKNMVTVGPFIEDGVMLLYEVWRKMYALLSDRL